MATRTHQDFLLKAIEAQLHKEVEKGIDLAVEEFRARLRVKVGGIALSVLKQYDMSTQGDTVTIRISTKDL